MTVAVEYAADSDVFVDVEDGIRGESRRV